MKYLEELLIRVEVDFLSSLKMVRPSLPREFLEEWVVPKELRSIWVVEEPKVLQSPSSAAVNNNNRRKALSQKLQIQSMRKWTKQKKN